MDTAATRVFTSGSYPEVIRIRGRPRDVILDR
jgi:hypothetical protein